MHSSFVAASLAILAGLPAAQAGLYLKGSPVLQVDGKTYERLIAKSNHTSIVEFYAPWCGHCQNLKPAFEKAAKNLHGLAKVAAVDCDEDTNKPFCGSMGVQGFPTLKIIQPAKKGGKPMVHDYNGPRTATGIVEAVVEKINNHVKRVTDKDIDSFLAEKNETAKAILFTDKGTTSALLRSIAIDFLSVITVAQVRSKETLAVEKFGVKSFPTLVLLPGGEEDGIVYDGEMKKDAMVKFLSQAGEPNPDPAPAAQKTKKGDTKKADQKVEKKADQKAEKKADQKAEKKADQKAEKKAEKAEKKSTKPEEPSPPKEEESPSDESSRTEEKPAPPKESAPAILTLMTPEELTKECLTPKSGTCVLAFVPAEKLEAADKALDTLAELAHKHAKGQRRLFPFFTVPAVNKAHGDVLKSLGLTGEVEIIAVNAKRGWWRRFDGDVAMDALESWVDAIRMSEGARNKLPEGLVEEVKETPVEESPSSEETVESKTEAESKSAESKSTESEAHDEL